MKISVMFFIAIFLQECSSKAIMRLNDQEYFKESPKIVTREDRCFIRWKYSDKNINQFYMSSESKIRNDSLIFFISALTSSGNMSNLVQLEEIFSKEKISLIKKGSVFWEDSEGQLTLLKIEKINEDDFKLVE